MSNERREEVFCVAVHVMPYVQRFMLDNYGVRGGGVPPGVLRRWVTWARVHIIIYTCFSVQRIELYHRMGYSDASLNDCHFVVNARLSNITSCFSPSMMLIINNAVRL